MPDGMVLELIEQGAALGIRSLCLSHYNEPLLDRRVAAFAWYARRCGYRRIMGFTNGGRLEEFASEDGAFTELVVSRKSHPAGARYRKTAVYFTGGGHLPALFPRTGPAYGPCHEPSRRLIVNHRAQYLFCCADLVGNFDLGVFPDLSLERYWRGVQRCRLAESVGRDRSAHPYCSTCPR